MAMNGEMKRDSASLMSVIRRKCLYCCTGSIKMAATCPIEACPLWPYRPEMPVRRKGKRNRNVQITIDLLIEAKEKP